MKSINIQVMNNENFFAYKKPNKSNKQSADKYFVLNSICALVYVFKKIVVFIKKAIKR